MRCGHFAQEQQALAVVDPSGIFCGIKDSWGAQQAFDRAYNRWLKRRKLAKGRFNGMAYGRKTEAHED